MQFRIIFTAFGTLLPATLAHMQMSEPFPLRSSLDSAVSYTIKDYTGTAPLAADGSNFPCKGYQNDRPILTTATYTAGNTYQMTIAGSASHGGGSCQISLSYDNGATFRVIKSMIGGCPLVSSYDFTIPSYAPNGTALLAWTWFNQVGNREMYMNGAWVDISSPVTVPSKRSPKTQRRAFATFEQLPYIWKANLPGINACVTVENSAPVFPDPGPDVIYGGGYSASSPVTGGNCDAPTPYGAAYRPMDVAAAGRENAVYPDNAAAVSVGNTSSAPATPSSSLSPATSKGPMSVVPNFTNTSTTATPSATSTRSVLPASTASVTSSGAGATTSTLATKFRTSVTSLAISTTSHTASSVPATIPLANGACSSSAAMGTLACLRSGAGFAMCNWSAWVDMGSVAAGTVCRGVAGSAVIVAA